MAAAPALHAQNAPATTDASAAMSSGEIKKVDKSTGKLTIKHGPLVNLGMDGMTMNFKVSDPAMLDAVKPGDKVNFIAEEPNGQLTVTKIVKQ
ncbi:copper-binding protein [Oxalicibacterium solurbis]|nr:copper-binding protein [Oxalicibacterium solurbis]